MLLDIILVILLIIAIFKGIRKGLIIAVFSVLAFIIGLAAAIKLSAVTAEYIGKAVKISDQWLPVISFAVVFIIVVLLIRWAAALLQKSVEFAMLGWVNKIGGMVLYAVLYVLIYSIIIFYADQLGLLKDETKMSSVTYEYIKPLAPEVMDRIGSIIPFFKGMFNDLEKFFEGVSREVPPAG